jgi:RNA polymerase sigma factor (sigma-70 family)
MSQTEAEKAPKRGIDFQRFFTEEYRRLTRAMLLISGEPWEAEDLAQEALARVYARWDEVAEMESPVGYLYRTALNLNRKRLRSLSVRARRAVSGGDRVDELQAAEDRLDVLRAVSSLPRAQREALVLVDWLDFDVNEAAVLLGIEQVSVRVRLHRGRSALRERFGDGDA